MRHFLAALGLAALAGCGVDGEPVRPSVEANVGAGSRGVSAGLGTTIVSGNMSVHVGTTF